MTMLPAVLATISIASRMVTPEESRVPIVRVKRATATLRKTGPRIGVFRMNLSKKARPCLVRMPTEMPTTVPTMEPMMMNQ